MDNMGFVMDEYQPAVGTETARGEACCSCVLDVTPDSMVPANGTTPAPVTPSPRDMAARRSEEAALLRMTEVDHIRLQFPSALQLAADEINEKVQYVRTERGEIVVVVQGDRTKPAILTYHDIGVNSSSFESFFNYKDMRAVAESFCVFHVNAPGQEDGAPTLPQGYSYPTLIEMAQQLHDVMVHFGLRTFIGFGIGAGACVLAKFAFDHPELVDALVLINCSSHRSGWVEWAYQKMNTHYLRSYGMTQSVSDYLIWYHLGRDAQTRNPDLVTAYRNYFARNVNPTNLSRYIDAYNSREDLGIARNTVTLVTAVLNVTGEKSPHADSTVALNARLNPNNSTWMKIQDCGHVMDEQPGKMSEAFRLFLQGEGFATPITPSRVSEHDRPAAGRPQRAPVANALGRACNTPAINITENPIAKAVAC